MLRAGDVVNQMMRPAGILIPDGAGKRLQAGFGQIEAQVMKTGMLAEATCISKTVGHHSDDRHERSGLYRGRPVPGRRATRRIADCRKPGTILVFLEPLYKGGLDGVTPGSSCIVNAYTSNHDKIADPKTSTFKGFALHAVDATGLVHALLLRIQALLMPIKTLVLSGH